MIFADKYLAQKLERAEAVSNAKMVEARAKISPASGAEWTEVGGAYAMFDGIASPLTQTFGLGLFDEIGAAEMERIEDFFARHAAPVMHEISPLADAALLPLLNARGYQPLELSSVMYRALAPDALPAMSSYSAITARVIASGEEETWARTAADGWRAEMPELADFIYEIGKLSARAEGGVPFLGELEGAPVATGMLFIYNDVALLAGASTVPAGRRQGAQTALLAARLRYAATQGCNLAMICAAPGSQSQRNAEKNNFRLAYTRTKWQRVK